MEERKNSYLFEGIENIRLHLSVLDVRIIIGDEFKVETTERYGDIIYVSQEGNQLVIRTDIKKRFGFIVNRPRTSELVITLEKNKVYQSFECDIKVGELMIDTLHCQKFILHSDVMDGMVKNLMATEVEIENAVGDIQLYAEVESSLKVRNATGEVDITLYGEEEDYAVYYENSIGDLRVGEQINSSTLSGRGSNRIHAPKRIDLKNSVGELSLRFRRSTC